MTSDDDAVSTPPSRNAPRPVQSVARAVGLLKALAAEERVMTLAELAAAVHLSKPSAFHVLRTLQQEGFVRKTPEAAYRLDWGLYELGSSVTRSVDVTRAARAHLDRMAELTGEAVLLSILDDDSVLYLDRGQAVESFDMVANMGRRSPLHTNASGKVLLAHQPEDAIQAHLARGLKARTQATLVDPSALAQSLASVRANGYATCWEEEELGLCSVAVPVWDFTGKVCAAVAIAGPAERVNATTGPGLVELLRADAALISRELGAPAPGRGGSITC